MRAVILSFFEVYEVSSEEQIINTFFLSCYAFILFIIWKSILEKSDFRFRNTCMYVSIRNVQPLTPSYKLRLCLDEDTVDFIIVSVLCVPLTLWLQNRDTRVSNRIELPLSIGNKTHVLKCVSITRKCNSSRVTYVSSRTWKLILHLWFFPTIIYNKTRVCDFHYVVHVHWTYDDKNENAKQNT